MKKMLMIPILMLALSVWGYAQEAEVSQSTDVTNDIDTNQKQIQNTSASGGDSQSDSASTSHSNANVNLTTNSVSNYQTRTPPLTTFPPYLPYWSHGGWGTIKAYFPNGPILNDQFYETTFDPNDPNDRHELRSVLKTLPHKGILEVLGGALNDVAVVLFDKPDTYFHGRGIEITNAIVRDRRPEGKNLLVFIDSNVDVALLAEEGYAYVGKISVEAEPDRNWDQAYKAAVAEALLWDVDIMLVSGGMKGVTTGSNVTFPSAAAGYSQASYSLSLLGSKAKGITEGKGKAMVSAEAYRYHPQAAQRRRIPADLYDRIRYRPPQPALPSEPVCPPSVPPCPEPTHPERTEPTLEPSEPAPASIPTTRIAPTAPAPCAAISPSCAARALAAIPPRRGEARRPVHEGPGITMTQKLFDMAGFPNDQQVGYVNIE